MAVLGNRVIKSIQRGTDVFTSASGEDITITEVDLNKASLNLIGSGPMKYLSSSGISAGAVYAKFTDSTTITTYSYSSLNRCYYSWEVVEYE